MVSLRLSVSAVLLAVLSATSAEGINRRQAPGVIQCAAAVYEDVPQILAACNFINLYNITVPAGKTLDLRSAQPGSVIFIGRAITFLPSPGFAGPLVRFGGSNLYVNGGTGFFDGVGSRYWGTNGTAPTLVSIENVKNSVFEKLIVANSPATAISITGSSGLTFKGARVLNQAAFVATVKPVLPGVVVASSSNIILGGFNVTTTGKCIDIASGSSAQVVASVCNGANLTANGTPQSTSQTSSAAPSTSNTTQATTPATNPSSSSPGQVPSNDDDDDDDAPKSSSPISSIIGSIFGNKGSSGGNGGSGGFLSGFFNGGRGGLQSGGKADGVIHGIKLWG